MNILTESGNFENTVEKKSFIIYSPIATKSPWIKIWFLARSLDSSGSGQVKVTLQEVCRLAGKQPSTIYNWLKKAKLAKVIKCGSVKKGTLTIYYASLLKTCKILGVKDIGASAPVPIEAIKDLKATACKVLTQQLQEKSQFAARKSLGRANKHHKIVPVEKLLYNDLGASVGRQSSTNTISNISHTGQSRVFVGSAFIPYGSCQKTIAEHLGCSDRTVRSYLSGVYRKQILQSKPEYKFIRKGLDLGLSWIAGSGDIYIVTSKTGSMKLYEPYGKSTAIRPGGHLIHPERFTNYFGKTWLYRCNVYDLDYELKSKKFTRNLLKKLIDN